MKILLTNDDGCNAPGILALYNVLQPCHEVLLVAPDREKSGVSHGITLNAPDIRFDEVRGVKITRQSSNNLSRKFDKRTDPRNRSYYWYAGIDRMDDKADTDVTALSQNYISITPIQCDTTDYTTLLTLENFSF